jgi:hypothetical protein
MADRGGFEPSGSNSEGADGKVLQKRRRRIFPSGARRVQPASNSSTTPRWKAIPRTLPGPRSGVKSTQSLSKSTQ